MSSVGIWVGAIVIMVLAVASGAVSEQPEQKGTARETGYFCVAMGLGMLALVLANAA